MIQDKIYTYVANILVAVNPYSDIVNLYTAATIRHLRRLPLPQDTVLRVNFSNT
jgi:myosin heavy subunit